MIDLAAANLTNVSEAERLRLRETCRKSLYFLCKAVLGFKDFTPEYHGPACAFVQDQSHNRKKFMLPRSTFKTHMASIGYPIWLTLQDPKDDVSGCNERILIVNASAANSRSFLTSIKGTYERNTIFQWLFPELIPDFKSDSVRWNQDEATVARAKQFPQPTFSAVGTDTKIVSRHFTRIILDDLIDDDHSRSPELMNLAIEWYNRVEPLLVDPKHEIIVVGTRWAMSDLYSHIDKTDGEYGVDNPRGYKIYTRSAIENGAATFPQRLPIDWLMDYKRKRGAYLFSCLYLNNPMNPDVNVFQESWLRKYTLDSRNWILLEGSSVAIDPTPMQRFVVIDIATSLAKNADYTAIVAMACDDKRRLFVLEAWKARVRPSQFIKQAMRFAFKWHAEAIYYESYGQQKLVEEPLRDAVAQSGRYVDVRAVKGSQGRGAIEKQIEFLSRYAEAGMILYRESMTDFLQEWREYPLSHPDLLAAASYAPKIFTFTYDDIPDLEHRPGRRVHEVVHAEPGLFQDKVIGRVAVDEDSEAEIERMLTISGRSRMTGY